MAYKITDLTEISLNGPRFLLAVFQPGVTTHRYYSSFAAAQAAAEAL